MKRRARPGGPRRRELANLVRSLARFRIIQLTGAPGVGKTWIAQAHAKATPGAVKIDLARATDRGGLISAFATALDAVPATGTNELDEISTALASRGPCLVIVDHTERVLGPLTTAVKRWAERAPEARFVIVGRERLDIDGSANIEVPPLRFRRVPGEVCSDAQAVLREAARRAVPTWRPRADDEGLLDEIAEALGGLPLALVLAGAQVPELGARALLIAVRRRGLSGATAKGDVLARAFEPSWSRLEPEDRHVLAAVSVFEGPFMLPAAAAVANVAQRDAARALAGLRRKSLVQHVPEARLGEERFAVAPLVRELALASPEGSALASTARLRALDHLGAFAEELCSHGSLVDFDRAHREIVHSSSPDLFRALDLALAQPSQARARCAVFLAVAGYGALERHRRTTRVLGILDQIERTYDKFLDEELRIRLRFVRGQLLLLTGLPAESREALNQVLTYARRVGDKSLSARALRELGRLSPPAEAQSLLEEGMQLARDVGDYSLVAAASNALCRAYYEQGEIERARARAEDCVVEFHRLGNVDWERMSLAQVATLSIELGDISTAAAALARARSDDDNEHWGPRVARTQSEALLDLELGNWNEALEKLDDAVGLYQRVGHRRFEAVLRAYAGLAHRALLRLDRARSLLEGARSELRVLEDARHGAIASAALALVWSAIGRNDARKILDEATEAAAGLGDRRVDALLRVARGELLLVEARRYFARGDASLARERVEAARGARAELEQQPWGREIQRSLEGRLFLRSFDAALATFGSGVSAPTRLRVQRDAEWFELDGAPRVALERRPLAQRLLAKLAAQREAAPGIVVSYADIIAAGWPHERVLPSAAKNRLHVAINTLRRFGLRSVLQTTDEGYRLDPGVSFEMAS